MINKFFTLTLLFIICILFSAPLTNAAYDDDFRRSSDLEEYPGITNLQSAQLDINLASVIHQENLQIIRTLQKIEERLSKVEASVKVIEQLAVGSSK